MDYSTTPQGILIWLALAASLPLSPSLAFQTRSVESAQALVPSLLGTAVAPGTATATTCRSDLGLGVLSFEGTAEADDRHLALGWFAQSTPALGYFTAVGARLPRADGPAQTAEELPGIAPANPDGEPTLSLAPWLGAGLRWGASERLHLSLEGRWCPGELALLGNSRTAGNVRFGLSLDLPW